MSWPTVEKQARENIVSCGCLYNSAIYLYNIMFSIYYITSESNQVCLWLLYVLNTTKYRLFFPILLRAAARHGSGLDVMMCARLCTGTTFVLIVLIRSVCCRRWKAKYVLLAFWLAALRLMDQSQEILLGHSVFFYQRIQHDPVIVVLHDWLAIIYQIRSTEFAAIWRGKLIRGYMIKIRLE